MIKINFHKYSFGFNKLYDYLSVWSCGYLYRSTLTKIQFICINIKTQYRKKAHQKQNKTKTSQILNQK